MFRKILIANRGEIACRVIRTARRMGVATVAVYSDADRAALHVEMADEAIRIGPAEVAKSYLNIAAIIAAARASGADAVHPGYGFLSENPDFVEAVEAAGLVFIGPSASAIRAMGLKDAAKALMEKAGVPVVPGYHGDRQDAAFLADEAAAIGYPVLIKARAGGGGKGMRRVEQPADFAAALESARREGESAFGDGRVLVEKYMAKPRHIEVQVFGDGHGNVVHLFERDCSLQRRHQKVIEEAPAPGMTVEMRDSMGAAAVRAAAAIGYSGAGTVEFIADVSEGLRQDRFYFMEMNTRLQVEHPVTEAITGLDLVEWQLRVAAGEVLPKRQAELAIDGWAFEARLYAENPARDFLPATGRLSVFDLPESARIDSGVRAGDVITPFYDPMIAKVITHGRSRAEALARLETALEQCRVGGVASNAGFLVRLCRHRAFAAGDVDTGLIGRAGETLFADPEAPEEAFALAALSALGFLKPSASPDPWGRIRGFRLWGEPAQTLFLDHAGAEHAVKVTTLGEERFRIEHNDIEMEIRVHSTDGRAVRVDFDDHSLAATVHRDRADIDVFFGGHGHAFAIAEEAGRHDEAAAGGDRLVAPMPGLVRIVAAQPGARVAKGDALVTMEAMKMELVLAAPRDGVVAIVPVAVGDQVAEGALLFSLEPEEAA
ncbi:acetyl/propionyl/methylcrotonyl-CoA carboxylase subunit alpha [Shinella curvata]|uniref:Acetyl/propionyl/methylcrotonyl-CoA carboxylase subunit alpha n=1 Tax=Shinella curvata TaxID=1817964 RepID=A0ABT8XCF0_9HYPH|nr:acetyl/propionyl/methylcrotonyl-CoA carboxylase subunit alpha [Shinella curvata]MCJ8054106.1 acetyl/propionyl/methylcrotonyl-CoA carboxylase subunit alpha [Shinella curvata]MDO6121128.1 acetyl/propionyl/methylcrotonyl-CoA carboxylase subunit alpha [Shinella curvata]